MNLLLLEAEQRAEKVQEEIDTVYFGGGTPSLIPPEQLRCLARGIRSIFPTALTLEWTAEANPGTLTPSWLETARAEGINRVSLGIQAFQDRLLRVLGRIHTASEADTSFWMVRNAGFDNISLDLMFGLPGQINADWKETLSHALSLAPTHLSAYGLIPEEGTPMKADLDAGRLSLPDPDMERQMYDTLKNKTGEAGFVQYEISNFSLPGYECRHNMGYWRQVPYLGLGVSAASMTGLRLGADGLRYTRETNPRSLADYARLIQDGEIALREKESVSPAEARFETMMLGLRMTEGVSEKRFHALHGVSLDACYGEKLRAFQARGLLEHANERWFLTARGMDIQNAILVDLMED